jgi:hypothetical protein
VALGAGWGLVRAGGALAGWLVTAAAKARDSPCGPCVAPVWPLELAGGALAMLAGYAGWLCWLAMLAGYAGWLAMLAGGLCWLAGYAGWRAGWLDGW